MRILSAEEQDLCQRILNGNGSNNYLGNIIDHRLKGVSIAITRSLKKVELQYTIRENTPTQEETTGVVDKIDEISVLILTLVNLIKLLEKDGYIMLLRKTTNVDDFSKFGRGIANLPFITNHFSDEKISELLIEYVNKEIYVTEEFRFFCANKFIARDELRHRKQIKRTTGILTVAIIALLMNTSAFIYSMFKTDDNSKEKIELLNKELKEIKEKINNLERNNASG